MTRADELRKLLAEEYGINSSKELDAALKRQPKIDIYALAGSLVVCNQVSTKNDEECA